MHKQGHGFLIFLLTHLALMMPQLLKVQPNKVLKEMKGHVLHPLCNLGLKHPQKMILNKIIFSIVPIKLCFLSINVSFIHINDINSLNCLKIIDREDENTYRGLNEKTAKNINA